MRSGLIKERGTWHEYRGVPVLLTLHPAHLLREPTAKRDAWGDLQQVMKRGAGAALLMKPTSAGALSERLGGALYGDADAPVSRVVTDSRVPLADGDVFVGLPGPRFDGETHDGCARARGQRRGARAVGVASVASARRDHRGGRPDGRAAGAGIGRA